MRSPSRNVIDAVMFAGAVVLAMTASAHSQEHQHSAPAAPNSSAVYTKVSAQNSNTPDPVAQANAPAATAAPAKTPKPKTATQLSFDQLKTLAGEWEGKVTLDPPVKGFGETKLHASMRVTSRGNTMVHEFQEAGTALDWTKYDHPVTMLYINDDQLNLIHYCDAGNRPRMVGKVLPDGKTIDFDFSELSGGNKFGHMHHGTFTFIDENHHVEEWTYMMPGDKPMHARMDLYRVPTTTASK